MYKGNFGDGGFWSDVGLVELVGWFGFVFGYFFELFEKFGEGVYFNCFFLVVGVGVVSFGVDFIFFY